MVPSTTTIRRRLGGVCALLACLLLVAGTANAGNPRYAGIVIDADSQEILYAENADRLRYPASLTKMMTLYLVFEALEEGRLRLDQPLPVSAYAAAKPASKLYVKPGSSIPVDTAIDALVIKSANDVAVVVAEALGGSDTRFAQMMTDKARELGMQDTVFRNPHGLPDAGQVTTARDMAVLSRHLMRDFPQYYPRFSRTRFTWQGKTITGHNRLLDSYPGADGLKTGFIRASGFNVATSAVRDERRLLTVVMGGFTAASRDAHTADLLDRGFLRASLADGRDWLASADISGGRLMPGEPLAPGQPIARDQRLASLGATPRKVDREVTVASPAAASTPSMPSAQPATQIARVERPVAAEAVAPAQGSVEEDPIRELIAEGAAAPGSLGGGRWGVQVGAFRDAGHARSLAARAADRLASELAHARVAVGSAESAGVYRARLVDMNEGQAHTACRRLVAQGMECMVVQASL
ncbi:D-alanyl-D-alanine carboxypeptidase DacF precursor [Halomonas sp. THAF5a]|uniref:D-alanyl-D-alanine carboxypeptidase family protein n=1 Tax=Halomonas sp. THAF5a TaxID=2587844 RepID=UPI0012689BDE|nr:D-alanyl-D-alanine carboxypeptidase family protein [Halomonas sp. THAF5a]QFU00218.1 D-alanyl-D-alanine carboxypeptidase DacF precursor [Halomonas sp. THAF5a]